MNLNGYIAHLVNLVANVAPWLAPLPTAWLVYDRTVLHLDWPAWVGIIAAATLEALGVAIMATALDLYRYQRGKRKSDPDAPLWMAAALIGLYFLAALLLVLVLDLVPAIATWSQAVFPVLSLASMALLALRMDHSFRLEEIATAKAEASAKRAERRRERAASERKAEPTNQERTEARFICDVAGCDFVAKSQNGLNAHQRAHKAKGEGDA